MKPPIKVNENGDVSYFDTIEAAEIYMEPADVENGEYTITDADGNVLHASVVTLDKHIFFGLLKVRIKKAMINRDKPLGSERVDG
jgi:hypothetical protein